MQVLVGHTAAVTAVVIHDHTLFSGTVVCVHEVSQCPLNVAVPDHQTRFSGGRNSYRRMKNLKCSAGANQADLAGIRTREEGGSQAETDECGEIVGMQGVEGMKTFERTWEG
jgi:hypothetical protein